MIAWNSNATTIANQSAIGALPRYLFIDQNNTLYTAETTFNRSRIWSVGPTNSTRTFSVDLPYPVGIFATLNGDVYIDNGASNHRVDKWASNANSSVVAMYVAGACFGLFVDVNDYLYCSLGDLHKVVKQLLNGPTNTSTIVAGNGTAGNTSYILNEPHGIFVDASLSLYVTDCWNDRVQLFLQGDLNGITISTNGSNGPFTLRCPMAVIMDMYNYLYISDWGNNRILGSGPSGFQCIAGCTNTNGSAADQLYGPRGIAFDSYGNLFVVDTNNNRLQKFFLALNSCSKFNENKRDISN